MKKKQKLYIERELKCKSENIVWRIISTDGGLNKWIADEVGENGAELCFVWGDTTGHHEIRHAQLLERVKNSHVRLRWSDEEDLDAFLEFRMTKNELTGDIVLHITDFAYDDDVDSLLSIWDQNFEQLYRTCGI